MNILEIAKFLVNEVKKIFSKNIAIIVVYGSVAMGGDSDNSDLDVYAIADNPEETDLPWDFVINNRVVEL